MPLDDPVKSGEAELSCCVPGCVLVDYFGIQPSPRYIAKPTDIDLRFNEIWGSITSTMLSSTMHLVYFVFSVWNSACSPRTLECMRV